MLLDTSAWIELFIKSEKGERVREILKNETCATSIATLAEIANWSLRENKETKVLIGIIENLSEVLNISKDISILAGELNFKRKETIKNWGMMDSFVLATSLIYGLKILTKDSHFKDLQNAEVL